MERIRTVCPRNCYSTCGMIATVDDGRLVKVEGDRLNEATFGRLCQKGYAYLEHVYHPERLKSPLKQRGERGSNDWIEIPWDQAIKEIAKKLADLREQSEQNSLLFYQYSGSAGLMESLPTTFWHLYGGCTSTFGSLCWGAGIEADRITFGDNVHPAPWLLREAKLIIIWGKNPAHTNVHEMRFIDEAMQQGAKLVVIDPRRTATAAKAHLWIRPRVGTDAALALGIARILSTEQKIDLNYVKEHTHGWESFRCSLEQYDEETVSAITGVDRSDMRMLAMWMGRIKPASVVFGYGPQRFANGGQTVRAVSMLPVLTGNIGLKGGGWHFANLQSFLKTGPEMPATPKGMRKPAHIGHLGSILKELQEPPIRAAWIQSANPVVCAPDSSQVVQGLMNLDYLVVCDLFMTDTARFADIILPAKSMFEQTDVMSSYWHPYLQVRDKCISYFENIIPESEVFRRLSFELGLDVSWFPENDDKWLNEILKRNDPDLSLDRLRNGPVIPAWAKERTWKDGIFKTPSGKIEIYSNTAKLLWQVSALPEYIASPKRNKSEMVKYPLQLMSTLAKQRIHSQFQNLPSMMRLASEPMIEINEGDALQRDIQQGDRVRVYNEKGSIQAKAAVSNDILTGHINIEKGWGLDTGASVNVLTEERMTDIGNGTAYHDSWVQVEVVKAHLSQD